MPEREPVRRFTELRMLCEGALELPGPQRADWIARMCEGEEARVAEVRELLRRVDEGGALAELLSGIAED